MSTVSRATLEIVLCVEQFRRLQRQH